MPPGPAPRPFLDGPHPLTFAHRGGANLWPENTLFAFEQALALGVDVIESDVRLTRDGELVLCHDASVERTTNGRGSVAELSLAELRRFDAGWHFSRDGVTYPHRGCGLRIPTLDEALAVSPGLRLNLDLKSDDPALIGRLVDAIELGRLTDRLLVASHTDAVIRRFRAACRGRVATAAGPREVAAFLAAVRLGARRGLRPDYDALQVPVRHALIQIVDGPFVEAAHQLSLPVHVFTIDSPPEMRRLLELGVDGLMTNRPDRLLPIAHTAADPPPASVRG